MIKPYEIYNSGDYLTNNPDWDEGDSAWKAEKVREILNKNKIRPDTVTEVGCGAGGVLVALRSFFKAAKYKGYDISPDAEFFWKKHIDTGIEFKVADFHSEITEKVNVLLMLDVIEHLVDPFDFLAKIRSRSDFYIFHIPLDLSSISVLRETPLLRVRNKVGHIHYFTKNLALSLLYECDYEVIDWSYTNASFSNKNGGIKKILSRIVRGFFYYLNKDLGVRLCGGETLIVLAKSKF